MRISFLVALLAFAVPGIRAEPAPTSGRWVNEETLVKVKLLQPLKSNHERSGDRIHFETTEDLLGADRAVLIPKGTPVVGTVLHANRRGWMGKPGRLEFTIDAVQVNDSLRVPLRTARTSVHGRDNAGASVIAGLFVGIGWFLVHGREVTVPAGKEFVVFVDQKTAVPAAGQAVALTPNLAPPPATPAPATLLAAVRPQLAHLQDFHLKSGGVISGTLRTQKDGMYFVITETGEVVIDREMIEFIAPKK